MSRYGGYYTMTKENWPLIGSAEPDGSFVVGALSGYGTMAACAAEYLVAVLEAGAEVPNYAALLGLARYDDPEFITRLEKITRRRVLWLERLHTGSVSPNLCATRRGVRAV